MQKWGITKLFSYVINHLTLTQNRKVDSFKRL